MKGQEHDWENDPTVLVNIAGPHAQYSGGRVHRYTGQRDGGHAVLVQVTSAGKQRDHGQRTGTGWWQLVIVAGTALLICKS